MRSRQSRQFLGAPALVFLILCGITNAQSTRPAAATSMARPHTRMSVDDVVRLLQAHIGEDIILAQVHSKAQAFDLSADDLIRLKTAGASDQLFACSDANDGDRKTRWCGCA
jgi:hypothetical protein